MTTVHVPFFRPDIGDREIDEVVDTLRSGWLTTGPRVHRFEQAFKAAVGSGDALAVNSCTAALHLAVEAMNVQPGEAVLVPTLTFAATAEVVRYQGGTPVLVDCDPVTLNMDLADAAEKAERITSGRLGAGAVKGLRLVGVIPVHVGGLMLDMDAVHRFAAHHAVWVVEDAAHAFPAAWRRNAGDSWQRCGQDTASVSCFSFYANKTITTGEGGMAVTSDPQLMEHMRMMALHGMSADAWQRYSGHGSWDYKIVAPGFKYNLTDIAAAIGLHQLERAEEMRRRREEIAQFYLQALGDIEELELPPDGGPDRLHAWHLFPIRLRLDRLSIDRSRFITEMNDLGVSCSVHWRPLHLHPYYQATTPCAAPANLPHATQVWERLVSLPLFSSMSPSETAAVAAAVRQVCGRYAGTLPVTIPSTAMPS